MPGLADANGLDYLRPGLFSIAAPRFCLQFVQTVYGPVLTARLLWHNELEVLLQHFRVRPWPVMKQVQDIGNPADGGRFEAVVFQAVAEILVLESISEAIVKTIDGQGIGPVTGRIRTQPI